MKWLVMALMLAGPAAAQTALDTDFEKLVEEAGSQDEVVTHGVTIIRERMPNGPTSYEAFDGTDQGAVGCWMMIAVHASAMDRQCELSVNPSERAALDNLLGGIARFYAENNVPIMPEGRDLVAVRSAIEMLIKGESTTIIPENCTGEPADFVESFVDNLSVTASEEHFQNVLGPKRIPVMSPC
ncbi:MAG: hypothetical protein ABJN34_07800 [Litoreibacter sp.]|uniref:hypothetical protein n=1 Tax=Litoreibacter sp. TaxID=1969459 RepID=UPI00329760A7